LAVRALKVGREAEMRRPIVDTSGITGGQGRPDKAR